MSHDVLTAWSLPWAPVLICLLSLALYTRGWLVLHRTRPHLFTFLRWLSFAAGLACIYLALGSPLDAYDDVLLSFHMTQHMLLLAIAPPLLLLGYPTAPMLRGLPRWVMRCGVGFLIASPILRRVGRAITNPTFAWIVMLTAFFGWHIPAAYELALRSEFWHQVEHACFFWTAVLYWWPVIRPWPSHPRAPRWFLIPYLLSADVANTVLSGLLTFSGHLFYVSYARVQSPFTISPLQDQVAAGVLMWFIGSIPFVIAGVIITVQIVSPEGSYRG